MPLCDPAVAYEDPFTRAPLHGPEGIAGRARTLWAAFPDVRLNATGPRLAGATHASAPAKLLGTHRAPLAGLAATGREVTVHVVCFAELRDGRFLRVRAFFDAYDAGVQLGVLPRPGTLGGRALLVLRGFGARLA